VSESLAERNKNLVGTITRLVGSGSLISSADDERARMTNFDYFGQDEFYFSESQGQLIPIDDMPFQQAFYSHRKLTREFGLDSYGGTPLYQKFIRKLCPRPAEIRQQLEDYGKACHLIREPGPWAAKTNGTAVRSKMRSAARVAKKRITCHKVDSSAGSYIEATIPVAINVRGEPVA